MYLQLIYTLISVIIFINMQCSIYTINELTAISVMEQDRMNDIIKPLGIAVAIVQQRINV